MQVTDQQVRKLMQEYTKTGKVGISSMRSGMNRKTGGKYLALGKLPSEQKVKHTWRTRLDPFAAHWELISQKLTDCPDLEGKALFDWLCASYPDSYHEGQLRTLQRKIRAWRAVEGPDKEVYFPQVHTPGKRFSTDFTHMDTLGITICGERFSHQLCHSVLCYSNWEWATICHSESMMSLKQGIQSTLLRLGHIPSEHWTDHSTAATHHIGKGSHADGWSYNQKYLDLMNHYGMTPRTINVDSPHENGDIESMNGVLKRRINQQLLLRGSRDFGTTDEYRRFLEKVMEKCNRPRRKRLLEEVAVMRLLDVSPLPEYYEETVRVSNWCTVNVGKKPYSVPSRLIGEKVTAYRYDERIEIYYKCQHQLTMPRLSNTQKHAINYRHVIHWLLRKPGAFPHYRYREDLFPGPVFRWAYDRLCEVCSARNADMDYLRILGRCADTMESQVLVSLETIRSLGLIPRFNTVVEFLPERKTSIPLLAPLTVDLKGYDELLKDKEVEP
jgi:transposase InsO family protein